MPVDVLFSKLNEVYLLVSTSHEIELELKDALSCKADKFWFHPLYRQKKWDGSVYFYNMKTRRLPIGLLPLAVKFCKSSGYTYQFNFNVSELKNDISEEELVKFLKYIFKDSRYFPRDDQITAIHKAITNKRGVLESCTGSGKSLILYSIIRFMIYLHKKVLLIVPSTNLCEQMFSDFKDYGWTDCDKYISIMYSGSKNYKEEADVLISTFQSAVKYEEEFFEEFSGLLVDECVSPYTLITMVDGSQKCICDIQVGDKIKTLNEKNNILENCKVESVYHNLSPTKDNSYEIEMEDGRLLSITGNHKVLTKNGWKEVNNLTVEDELINA